MTKALTVAIELVDLQRTFTRRAGKGLRRKAVATNAVDGITLTVNPAEIVGWLGPNGAGKSTTIKMCTGILVPTGGTVRVCGLDPVTQRRELARRIGVVFGQRSQLWWDLPLADSFELLHRVHQTAADSHRSRLQNLVELFDIGSQLSTPVRQLSLGQRMRGELLAALLHNPEILFLDEPTIGLDVVSKHAVREALLALRKDAGVTIVLTTHDLGDVRRLCDRVTVIDHGKIALDTSLDGLLALAGSTRRLVVTYDDDAADIVSTHTISGCTVVGTEGPQAMIDVDLAVTSIPQAIESLSAIGRLADLTVEERDIEAVVRDLYTGRT
jgi:ABC-2 type transport system ATP-binding protein